MEENPDSKPLLRTAAMRAASAMSFTETRGLYDGGLDSVEDESSVEGDELFTCIDCGINTHRIREYYMVENHIWEEYVPEYQGMLCIECLEARMGRELNASDFPSHLPINAPDGLFFPHSDRLRIRLTATG